jgi:hypothetical protein
MQRVSVEAVHEPPGGRHHHVGRVRPIREQDDGSEQPTPVAGAQKCNEPEEPAHDREARLHHVAPLIGRLPVGEERAIIKLKARWLLGDVDVDRCPYEDGGNR